MYIIFSGNQPKLLTVYGLIDCKLQGYKKLKKRKRKKKSSQVSVERNGEIPPTNIVELKIVFFEAMSSNGSKERKGIAKIFLLLNILFVNS